VIAHHAKTNSVALCGNPRFCAGYQVLSGVREPQSMQRFFDRKSRPTCDRGSDPVGSEVATGLNQLIWRNESVADARFCCYESRIRWVGLNLLPEVRDIDA
jgi:hypothetical protein